MYSFLVRCPNVPMSQCPIIFLTLVLLNRLRGKPFNHIQVFGGTMGQWDKGTKGHWDNGQRTFFVKKA